MPFLPFGKKTRGWNMLFFLFFFHLPIACVQASSSSFVGCSQSNSYFAITSDVLAIQNLTLQLKIREAGQQLQARRLAEPKNKMYDFLESYTWFFTLFIQEEEAQYKKAQERKKKLLENIRQGDKNSPYYLFCQAEILLQWATIHLKFNDKTRAAYDVYEAYQLLVENKKKFPAFKENDKSLSIMHALAQSLPGWVQKLSGIKGSVSQGTQEIESLVQNLDRYPLFKEEILAIYVYILFYTKQEKEKAYEIINKFKLTRSDSPLLTFLCATITQKTGRNDEAIQILEKRKTAPGQIPFYYLDFLHGKYKLYRLDKDADTYMLSFVNHFKGQHYLKEAYQKLYWFELLYGETTLLRQKYFQKVFSSGKSLIDEDLQSLSECKGSPPHPILLKARLLYDGGYYHRSQKLLVEAGNKGEIDAGDQEEFQYRLGRNADALLLHKDAILYYKKTIQLSSGKKYYACSAALHLGLIHEKNKNVKAAKQYFRKCLELNPEGYSTSLHQKAKTALARIQN